MMSTILYTMRIRNKKQWRIVHSRVKYPLQQVRSGWTGRNG